jgi:signal transduction histidine kinase
MDGYDWISRIFQRLGRTPAGSGSSLGPMMAQKIVEAHGGLLWAEARGPETRGLAGVIFHILL